MHLIVAHADWPSSCPRDATPSPALEALIATWRIVHQDLAHPDSLCMPHERAWAYGFGQTSVDGLVPWATHLAARDGVVHPPCPLGLLSPTHWHVTTDRVAMVQPDALDLSDAESMALWQTLSELMQAGGYTTHWGHATRWYATHADWATLPTASIDRVMGDGIEHWQPPGDAGRRWQRLQNEMQMVLHTHPVNEAREVRGVPTINSVWLSGNGPTPSMQPMPSTPPDVQVDQRLRKAYLAADVPSWLAGWRTIDDEVLSPWLNAPPANARLTLCGRRGFITWAPGHQAWWRRWLPNRSPALATMLATL